MTGVQLAPADPTTWRTIVAGAAQATFFHTPLWLDLALAANPGWSPATLGFELPSGARGVVPLVETGRAGGARSRLVSSANWCYGGPVAEAPLTDEDALEVLAALRREARGTIAIVESPVAPLPSDVPGFRVTDDFTSLVRLDGGIEAFYAGLSTTRGKRIRQARKDGVHVRRAVSLEDFRAYYAVYQESLARWGDRRTSEYPWQLFAACHALSATHPHTAELWLAEHEGAVVAGVLAFVWGAHTVEWHAAASERGFHLQAASLLRAEAIEGACQRGCTVYDFNPSGGHEGVVEFKRSFGVEQVRLRVLTYERPVVQGVRAVKKALRRSSFEGVR